MHPNNFESMDDFIDAALRSEAVRTPAIDLQRRIQDRIRMSAMAGRERRRFRARVLLSAGAFVLMALGFIAAGSGVAGVLRDTVPGALGYYDYWSMAASRWGGLAAGMGLAMLTGTVALGAFVERWAARSDTRKLVA